MFEKIRIEDNDKYLQLLKKCKEIPSELATAYSFGYDAVFPGERAYNDGLCWHKLRENGRNHLYPPVGDWDNVDWKNIFPMLDYGTRFEYVPAYLKDLWIQLYPNSFQISTDRGNWDYIYDIKALASLDDIKRLYKKFINNYCVDVVDITKENVNDIISITKQAEVAIQNTHNDSFSVMYEDDQAMYRILNNWDKFSTISGILISVEHKPISYAIWEKIDDKRYVYLFNKSLYDYKGVNAFCTIFMLDRLNEQGGELINCTCDANVDGLRRAKLERHPIYMLEKYTMIWKGIDGSNG